MELTTKQVAEKLGITPGMLRARVNKGEIPSINKPEKGKRIVFRFDSKTINNYLKENGQVKNRKVKSNVSLNPQRFMTNINTKLNSIESKLDSLLELWK